MSAFHVEIIRHGTQLTDCTVGLRQNHAGGVTVTGTRGIQLFERSEPGSKCGEVMFASPELARERLVLRSRGCQARVVDRPQRPRGVERGLCGGQGLLGCRS